MDQKIQQRTMYLDKRTYAQVCRDGYIVVVDNPLDVIAEILSRLPIVNIIQCKTVCKSWYKLTTERHFIDMQKNRALCQPRRIALVSSQHPQNILFILYDQGEDRKWKCRKILAAESIDVGKGYIFNYIAGSCNGLLLLGTGFCGLPLLIVNPITGECVELPKLDPGGKDIFTASSRCSIGFDPIGKKYKVVCLYRIYRSGSNNDIYYKDTNTRCQIMTLGEGSWRPLEVPYSGLIERDLQTVFLNGAFHWLIDGNGFPSSKPELLIRTLDITSEKFHITNFFPSLDNSGFVHLTNMAESLALVESVHHNDNILFRIWYLVSSNIDGSLVYQYTSCAYGPDATHDNRCIPRMIGRLNDESFLYQEDHFIDYRKPSSYHLALYSTQKEESIILEISDIPEKFVAELFVPTLVSPTAIM